MIDSLNPYALIMRIRRWLYRRGFLKSCHPGVPVISIGNISMGGTGKSPMTIYLAELIASRWKKKVAVVSRGYRRKSHGFVLVRDGSDVLVKVEQSGDEAMMIAKRLPDAITIVDEDRAHGAREAMLLGAEVILLDDGFQHRRLKRDLDIVLLNDDKHAFPFGKLREGTAALKDADLLVGDPPADISFIQRPISITLIPTNTSIPLERLRGARVLALSSIANPSRFHATLRELGAEVIEYALRDHATYSASRTAGVVQRATNASATLIVTTEKDLAKLGPYVSSFTAELPLAVLSIATEITRGNELLISRLEAILG